MILVFGGAFNGKLGFVKEEFEVSEEDIFSVSYTHLTLPTN